MRGTRRRSWQVEFTGLAVGILAGIAALGGVLPSQAAERAQAVAAVRPNVVVILCDDLGYGDVRCYNPQGKIATPQIDRLAASGMRFTDAHTASSVCTPTRYALLTGRYAWRSRLSSGVLGGMSPRLIEPGRLTVAELMRRAGYRTACVGKWHLGMDWPRKPNTPPFDDQIEPGPEGWRADFTRPIAGGPCSVGFDRYFGISASLDMVPYTFIENDRVTVVPTVDKSFPLMLGKPRPTRRGPAAAAFEAIDVLPTLTRKAIEYLDAYAAGARAGEPFFLYVPLASPHTPIAPSPEWQGRSGLNPYADFVMQTDDCIGRIAAALDARGLADNTVLFVTSDNGCSPEADFPALAAGGHNPSDGLRGCKSDIFDGGHRVPLVVRWPGKVRAGAVCDQLVGLVDLTATCAALVGATLPPNAAEDSVSFLPLLVDRSDRPVREAIVHHSISGHFAIRRGRWKLALCPGSGGWSPPVEVEARRRGLTGVQLYDMAADPAEQRNVAAAHPEVVAELSALVARWIAEGRSTPGPAQKNAGPIDLWKRPPPATPPKSPPARGKAKA